MRWINSSSGLFRWISSALFLIDHFILLTAAFQAALGPRKEPAGLLPGSDDRPADVLLPFLAIGKDAALDVSVVNPLQQQLGGQVAREGDKVQHAFNIKMGKYSDRCEAEGILFSWRLWESLSSRRCYIYTRWDNDQERILKTIFFTVKSILEWGSWWTQLPLGWVQTGIFNFFSSSSGTSRRGEFPQYCSTTFPYYSLLLSADTPCPSDYHFISCVPAEPRLVQGRGRGELS